MRSLIDSYIRDQQELSAVERFAEVHARGGLAPGERFRELLPAGPPKPGEQYAFEVDLDKCSGCKACVTACHSLNGLDENETWREVGLLIETPRQPDAGILPAHRLSTVGETPAARSVQHVTTACHHCVDPACLNGCPVLAYDKDPLTGIVRHLDDQCIGCQYCVLKCPYDVPKYNARLGIVRKCDMCANRLAVGEAPACAQACPNEAIRITKVQTKTVTIGFRERGATFLNGAPSGDYTLPTTRYVSGAGRAEDSAPNLVAADHAEIKSQPAHWPLVFMLVLTQASVGAACVSVLPALAEHRVTLLVAALGLALAGLGASVFHLGRPLGAWRGFLNVRRSWMSREIVVFGAYPALVSASMALPGLSAMAAATGLLGVCCSAIIYADTRRELWRARRTLPLFLLTTLISGAASALVLQPTHRWFVAALVVVTVLKLAVEISALRHVTDRALTPMRKTALLITGRFQPVAFARTVAVMLGGVGLPVLLSVNAFPAPHIGAIAAFALLIAGEFCERFLFFRCVVAPKMPGGMA